MVANRLFWEDDVTVAVANVHVHYRVPSTEHVSSSRSSRSARALTKVTGGQPKVLVRALAGVSLAAYRGESVGIVGTNGRARAPCCG